ncbi:MAG: hypothetical protein RL141_243 [Candidatus Parcubacteria bacterium]
MAKNSIIVEHRRRAFTIAKRHIDEVVEQDVRTLNDPNVGLEDAVLSHAMSRLAKALVMDKEWMTEEKALSVVARLVDHDIACLVLMQALDCDFEHRANADRAKLLGQLLDKEVSGNPAWPQLLGTVLYTAGYATVMPTLTTTAIYAIRQLPVSEWHMPLLILGTALRLEHALAEGVRRMFEAVKTESDVAFDRDVSWVNRMALCVAPGEDQAKLDEVMRGLLAARYHPGRYDIGQG